MKTGKCICGHSGDGKDTDHVAQVVVEGILSPGHGHCTKCACRKFTWVGWMEEDDEARVEDN